MNQSEGAHGLSTGGVRFILLTAGSLMVCWGVPPSSGRCTVWDSDLRLFFAR